MKEKRRGFTLIELLAVIVILAIIALIATPIVLNLINTARKGAFARSAEGVLKASKLYYTSSLVEDITPTEITFKCNNIECISSEKSIKLDVDGNMGTGDVTITDDGKVSFELGNGTYCAEKKKDSSNIKVSKKICGELVINKPSDLKITYKTEKAGEITVVGSVSNDDAEIKSYEFSIDNGATWVKAAGKMYTFRNLEIGKEYKVLMRVTNLKNEQEQIESEPITTSLINDIEYDISNKNEWSVSKTVTITGPEIDENIYKIIYSLDGINYQDYIEPIKFTENGAIKVDIVKKEDYTSILNKIITINVIKIDNIKPSEVTFTYESKTEGLVITANAIDEESGIYGYQFSIDNGNTFTDIQTSNEYIFKNLVSGTTYNLIVKAVNNTYQINEIIDNNSLESLSQDFKIANSVKFIMTDSEQSGTIGLDQNGNIWVWGDNNDGYLGTTISREMLKPYKLSINTTFKKVSKGSFHVLALDKDGHLWTWGNNGSGQLGNNSKKEQLIPAMMGASFNGRTFVDIFAIGGTNYAIDNYGKLWVWGNNSCGSLGIGGNSDVISPVLNNYINTKVKKVVSSLGHTLVLDENGDIWSWGCNGRGEFCDGTTSYRFTPQKVNLETKFIDIAAGDSYSLVLDKDGNIWAAGDNRHGQLGNGNTSTLLNLTKITSNHKFTKVYSNAYSSYALDVDGRLWSWGKNNYGQLGNGTQDDLLELTQINIDEKIVTFNPGGMSVSAIDENNDMWVWGTNDFGTFGDGTKTSSFIPKKVEVTE